MSDVEKALEEIAEKEAVVEETTQNDKKKVDSTKAAEIRYRTLENLHGTQKRQRKDEVENETATRAKCRRSGSDSVMTAVVDISCSWILRSLISRVC